MQNFILFTQISITRKVCLFNQSSHWLSTN